MISNVLKYGLVIAYLRKKKREQRVKRETKCYLVEILLDEPFITDNCNY